MMHKLKLYIQYIKKERTLTQELVENIYCESKLRKGTDLKKEKSGGIVLVDS